MATVAGDRGGEALPKHHHSKVRRSDFDIFTVIATIILLFTVQTKFKNSSLEHLLEITSFRNYQTLTHLIQPSRQG